MAGCPSVGAVADNFCQHMRAGSAGVHRRSPSGLGIVDGSPAVLFIQPVADTFLAILRRGKGECVCKLAPEKSVLGLHAGGV
jgi:hypothetical protein